MKIWLAAVLLCSSIFSAVGVGHFASATSSAIGGPVVNTMAAHFLGLPAWYDNLPVDGNGDIKNPPNEKELSKYIWTIVMNVAGMFLGIAGYLCILIVIYGGYLYLFSVGDPGKAAKGKKSIVNALIGIAICSFASTISTVVSGLLSGVADTKDGKIFFNYVFNHCMVWAGVICVLIITISGIQYAISNGDPGKMQKAKQTIVYACVGLGIVLLAAGIVNFALGVIG